MTTVHARVDFGVEGVPGWTRVLHFHPPNEGDARVVNLRDPAVRAAIAAGDDTMVRIDRATEWGNPYRISAYKERETVIEQYRLALWARVVDGEAGLVEKLAALHGKLLACWCAPARCHGDIIRQAAAWAYRRLQTQREATT